MNYSYAAKRIGKDLMLRLYTGFSPPCASVTQAHKLKATAPVRLEHMPMMQTGTYNKESVCKCQAQRRVHLVTVTSVTTRNRVLRVGNMPKHTVM
jgi:hypothetical protein